MKSEIHLGFEIGSGAPVAVPCAHIAVTGQTQASGKTTTLEALAKRSEKTVLTFITKRGESSFADSGRVQPYFRDRADWQFVTSIIDATLQEKNKFLRPWIMKICRTTRTLAEVHHRVIEAMQTAKGINEGVYTQLDSYLELIVPEIARAKLARELNIVRRVNVMDVSEFSTPMQMLFVQSAIDYINANYRECVVVIPEAWEFVPEGKGSPVKNSAIALVRKGAAIHNFIWVDSQDMAGVDKTILRGCAVWLIGVQREANELKRNLANIPANVKKPNAAEVAGLERGQFFACWGKHCVKTYVQPAWMETDDAVSISRGFVLSAPRMRPPTKPIIIEPKPTRWPEDYNTGAPQPTRTVVMDSPNLRKTETMTIRDIHREGQEPDVKESEAEELRRENASLKQRLDALEAQNAELRRKQQAPKPGRDILELATPHERAENIDLNTLKNELVRMVLADPAIITLSKGVPEIQVTVQRKIIDIDESSLKGRIAKLIAAQWFDEPRTSSGTRKELKRTGPDVNDANLWKQLQAFVADGFLTAESDKTYLAVKGMKVNIREAA